MADVATAGLAVRLRQDRPIPLDATFECGAGSLVALVGPSGSGKTTILRCIAGLNRPSAGRVVAGSSVWLDTDSKVDWTPQRRAVGIVFQNYALFPHMTAQANVTAAMGHVPSAQRDARARALLDLVNLSGLEERRPDQLSGGQQQRVALARALAREPAVLLLDEPFSAVDQVTRRKLQRELVSLRRAVQVPIILVTHDLEEAQLLADRLIILSHGRTLQAAPPADLLARPANALVARLVGLRNVFEGEIARHEPDTATTWLRWRGRLLEAPLTTTFDNGSKVNWVIPPESIILHRRDRPSRGERENPIQGRIAEFLVLGENASIAMQVDDTDLFLTLSVPTHVARRNNLGPDAPIAVSLLKSAIHLMPWGPPDD